MTADGTQEAQEGSGPDRTPCIAGHHGEDRGLRAAADIGLVLEGPGTSLYSVLVSNSKATEPMFLPRGVAGPDRRTGFVTADFKAIEAIDLLKGVPIWSAQEGGLPRAVFEDRLAVLRAAEVPSNQLEVLLLDLSQPGKLAFKSDPIIFPSWVTAALLPGEFFDFNVHIEQNELVLVWCARARYQGGAPPPEYVVRQEARDDAGVARIDLQTGKVEMLPYPGDLDTPLPEALQQAILFSYQKGSSRVWHTAPWDIGGRKAAISGEVHGDKQRLSLQKWDPSTQRAEEPTFLLEGRALVSQLTPDGRFLFIHSEAPAATSEGGGSPWSVFSAETGSLVSELTYEAGAQEPCVLDDRAYYMVQAVSRNGASNATVRCLLKSCFLSSGALQWERLLSEAPAAPRPPLRP